MRDAATVRANGFGRTLRRIDAAGAALRDALRADRGATAATLGAAGAAGAGGAAALRAAAAARAEQRARLARIAADLVLIAVVNDHLQPVGVAGDERHVPARLGPETFVGQPRGRRAAACQAPVVLRRIGVGRDRDLGRRH